ncbi:hypothetical protein IV203_013973 [Nitzschia inconspicua]|uniref:Uncharacterized protein n=1 Tax=Nitzschia inconspicua TaxID=303405 RepID=A0A9K3P9C6_9STRA|nr:hypothetical protein IV203_014246 [Nitzschia inconspicua]KAG7374878.1 hypothetical protein IV203_013973 [Nitzschia inconspicua]
MPWNGARRRTFEGHSSLPDVSQEDLVHIQLAGFLVSAASRVQEFQGFGDQFLFLKAMDDLLFHRASLTGKTDSYMFDIPDMNREDEGDIFSFFLLWPGIGNETK